MHQQEKLLAQAERFFEGRPVSDSIRKAFLDTPRHLFVHRFYSSKQGKWIDLNDASIEDHLLELYADHPLGIYQDQSGRTLSTISQPSLVINMLDLLDLKPGMRVFELGCGSGWNAALMARLVQSEGRVVTVEIIETLAHSAKRVVEELGLWQVDVIAGDGTIGVGEHAPFQRGVFTASAWNLPPPLFEQIEREGLLLLVIKLREGLDLLTRLRKESDTHFHSELHFPCSFVPVAGSESAFPQEPRNIETIATLEQEIAIGPTELNLCQLNIEAADIADFIRFAEIVHDCQIPYLVDNPEIGYPEEFSGIINENGSSLVLFNDDGLKTYGAEDSLVALRRAAKRWRKAGKPSLDDLSLSIHRSDTPPAPRQDQWLVNRGDCILEWAFQA